MFRLKSWKTFAPFLTIRLATAAEQVGDGVKDEMYRSVGFGNLYSVSTLLTFMSLGTGQKYNTLYTVSWYADGTLDRRGGHGRHLRKLVIGIDRTTEAFVRPVARNSETGGTFTALPDDQYAQRQDKVGFYGGLEEGRVLCLILALSLALRKAIQVIL